MMEKTQIKTLLIIEDNPGDARLLREMLGEKPEHDVDLMFAATMSEAEKHLSLNKFDIILLDLGLPDAQGLNAIRRTRAAAPAVPLVVLTGMDDAAVAAQSLQEGAQDYLIKGQIESRGLVRALRYATERKRLERLKDEFVSTVSHELRTPLTSITASLGLLMGKADGVLPAPIARLIEIAHNNSQRLVRLVNDILDIEKLEANQVEFDLRRIEVRALVEQAVDANAGFAEVHQVTVRIADSGRGDAIVRADADRLIQAITNLLTNAIKYSPTNKEVVVTIDDQPDLVRISICDQGSGVPLEFKSQIFERFAQADATNTRTKSGTGLGLSIVRQIATRLRGKVGFFDNVGHGSTFYIELPSWEGRTDLALLEGGNDAALTEAGASLQTLVEVARCRLSNASAVMGEAI
jgi:signal transduction histidine kinase